MSSQEVDDGDLAPTPRDLGATRRADAVRWLRRPALTGGARSAIVMAMPPAALVWLVVVLHVLFAFGESAGWRVMARRFGLEPDATHRLALNQAAYNAGVAALLAWAFTGGQLATVSALLVFIVAMSVVGAVTMRWRILFVQGGPALIALLAR